MLLILILLLLLPHHCKADSFDPSAIYDSTTSVFKPEGVLLSKSGDLNVMFEVDITAVEDLIIAYKHQAKQACTFAAELETKFGYDYSFFTGTAKGVPLDLAYSKPPPGHNNICISMDRAYTKLANELKVYRLAANKFHDSVDREERAGILSVAMQTIFGVYGIIETEALKSQVEHNKKNIKKLFLVAGQHTQTLNRHAKMITDLQSDLITFYTHFHQNEQTINLLMLCQLQLNDVRRTVDLVHAVFRTAYMHRLSPALLEDDNLADVVDNIKHSAGREGYRAAVQLVEHLFQLDTSIITTSNGHTAIILHVPITKAEDELKIYRYISLPIAVGPKTLLSFHPTHPIIAVDKHKRHFRTMTTDDLLRCKQRGYVTVCEDGNTILEADSTKWPALPTESRCTLALYKQRMEDAEADCPMTLSPFISTAIQTGPQTFVIYSQDEAPADIVCKDREDSSFSVRAPRQDIKLPPGCELTTGPATLTSFYDIAATQVSYLGWTGASAYLERTSFDVGQYEHLRDVANLSAPADFKQARQWLRDNAILESAATANMSISKIRSNINHLQQLAEIIKDRSDADSSIWTDIENLEDEDKHSRKYHAIIGGSLAAVAALTLVAACYFKAQVTKALMDVGKLWAIIQASTTIPQKLRDAHTKATTTWKSATSCFFCRKTTSDGSNKATQELVFNGVTHRADITLTPVGDANPA
jgi:hypothetical protein